MPARSEPLLWVQLLGAGVFPLEALLLLLLLAGSDPGPVPALERLLCWALGALTPVLLLWRRPADVWSLLLLQTPQRARRPLQQRLSRLQDNLGLRLALALAGVISLPLLWWLDEHAAVASALSPLAGSPRLVALLLAALLLALMLWQWQQLLQALWLLTRSPEAVAAARPMPQAELEQQRLCLGLPLLLPDPLRLAPAAAVSRGPVQAAPAAGSPAATGAAAGPAVAGAVAAGAMVTEAAAAPSPSTASLQADLASAAKPAATAEAEVALEPLTEPPEPSVPEQTEAEPPAAGESPSNGSQDAISVAGVAAAVEPEQATEQGEGGQLDQQIG